MHKNVEVFDYAGPICKALKKGVLLTTAVGEKVNTMTIGWGTLGIEWGKPIFVAYVRESRYTREILDKTGEFTVNIPLMDADAGVIGYCGKYSGRDRDKIADMGLTLEQPEKIAVPGIRQLPLTLECKVLFRNVQDESGLPEPLRSRYYPGEPADFHIAYYAEIVTSYKIV